MKKKDIIFLAVLAIFVFMIVWYYIRENKIEKINKIDNKRILHLNLFKVSMEWYIQKNKTFPIDQYKLFEYIQTNKYFNPKDNMLDDKDNLTYTAEESRGPNLVEGKYILWMKMENPKHCDVGIYSDDEILQVINKDKELKKLFLSAGSLNNWDKIHKLIKKLKEKYWNKANFKKWCLKIIAGKIVLRYGMWWVEMREY